MTLNCIHTFIVAGSFLYWYVMRPASQRFFILTGSYLRIVIIPHLATFLGTNSLSVPMCRKAVNQSISCLDCSMVKVSDSLWCHWLSSFIHFSNTSGDEGRGIEYVYVDYSSITSFSLNQHLFVSNFPEIIPWSNTYNSYKYINPEF